MGAGVSLEEAISLVQTDPHNMENWKTLIEAMGVREQVEALTITILGMDLDSYFEYISGLGLIPALYAITPIFGLQLELPLLPPVSTGLVIGLPSVLVKIAGGDFIAAGLTLPEPGVQFIFMSGGVQLSLPEILFGTRIP